MFVPARDVEELHALKEEIILDTGKLHNFTVENDEKLEFGCRVETDFSSVDAEVYSQLKNLEDALVGGDISKS